MNFTSRTSLLLFLAHLDPRLNEPLVPHLPILSAGARRLMAAAIIKTISKGVKDAAISKELHQIGKTLFERGKETSKYDDPYGSWPPPPRPWHDLLGIDEEEGINPQPLPPHEQPYYGALLFLLSNTFSLENLQESVRNIGESLMKKH